MKILDFGAVVEFVPGNEVLLHISEISWERIDKVTDRVNLGDKFDVSILELTQKPKSKKFQESSFHDQKEKLGEKDDFKFETK